MDPKEPPPDYAQPQQVQLVAPQPQQAMTTVVIQQQPQLESPSGMPQNVRNWSHGLCGCCDDMNEFCFMCWFSPFYWCRLSSRMGENACGPCCCCDLFRVGMRSKVRAMYGIQGTLCDDVCTIVCCAFCAGIQIGQELKEQKFAFVS